MDSELKTALFAICEGSQAIFANDGEVLAASSLSFHSLAIPEGTFEHLFPLYVCTHIYFISTFV